MKCVLLCFIFLGFLQTVNSRELEVSLGAESVVLMNAKTGRILFSKNKDEKSYPASTTKIATFLYATHLSKNELNRKMVATQDAIASITPQAKRQSNYRSPSYWLETDGTHIGIKRGEEFQFKDLLYALMVASANDAANVIAQNLGGTIPKFMDHLNQYLKKLGCLNTSFNNPHGLHHPSHVTSAYDLAIMAREGLKDPLFREIVSTSHYTCPETNLEHERNFRTTNLLLRRGSFHYVKAIGIKTGTTSDAGKNLVAAAEDENRSLIAVILNHKAPREELYRDAIKLFDAAFQEKKRRLFLLKQGEQTIIQKIKGAKTELKTYLPESLYSDFYPSEEVKVKGQVIWERLTLPIEKNQKVASIRMLDVEGNLLNEAPLLAMDEVRATVWHQVIYQKFGRKTLFTLTALSLLLIIWRIRRRA